VFKTSACIPLKRILVHSALRHWLIYHTAYTNYKTNYKQTGSSLTQTVGLQKFTWQ